MSKHLSQEQLSEWVLGGRDLQAEEHLQTCQTCQSELQRFQSVLGEFRSSIRDWSNAEYSPYPFHPPAKQASPLRTFRSHMWMHSVAIALALFFLCLFLRDRSRDIGTRPRRAESVQSASISDAALWSEVDQETSEIAPAAFERLEESSVASHPVSLRGSLGQKR